MSVLERRSTCCPLAIFPGHQLLRHSAVTLHDVADEERLHAINPLPTVFLGVGGFAVGVQTSSFILLPSSFPAGSTSKNSSANCSIRSHNSGKTTVTR